MSSACRYVRTAGCKNTGYFPEEARAFLDHIPVSPDAASSDRTTRDGVNSTN
jgi:hypothetical protein